MTTTLTPSSLSLQVSIDKDSGFCFGVVYAIEMAEEILREEGRLYCLGDIVHNDEEVSRLTAMGLIIINHEQLKELRDEKVLIRAHGEPAATYRLAMENGLELIDASCPVVLKLQNRIKNAYDKGEHILIYGKHGHAEVIGLQAQTSGKGTVFQDLSELDLQALPKEVTLFSQTTKSTDKFYALKDSLLAAGIEVDANDTICRQVSNRDEQLKRFASGFDQVVFVAGTKSSNGKVLFEACRSVNARTHFISNPEQIDPSWFSAGEKVGICGATSTPMWLMEAVQERLLGL